MLFPQAHALTEKKEFEIVIGPEASREMERDPVMAEAMKDLFAAMKQAIHGVETGQYETFEDAMEAITGDRPELVNPDDSE